MRTVGRGHRHDGDHRYGRRVQRRGGDEPGPEVGAEQIEPYTYISLSLYIYIYTYVYIYIYIYIYIYMYTYLVIAPCSLVADGGI